MPDRAPLRMPLILAPGNRDRSAGKDARLVNGFVESSKEALHVYKRPGVRALTGVAGGPGSGNGGGIYQWRGDIYSVFGTTLYKNGVSIGTVGFDFYTFSETLGAVEKLFIKGRQFAYVWDPTGPTLTQVTDVDYPALTARGQAYLFGVTYVMDDKANIYGSDVNDPSSWDPLNLIVANIEADAGMALAKQLTYVVALKQWSTEVFYDAGNATGSRLTSVQGAKINFGLYDARTLQDIDGDLFWVSATRSGSLNVVMMSDLKAQIISDSRVERLLEGASSFVTYSWGAKVFGHKLYGITFAGAGLTLVFDAREKIWYEWTTTDSIVLPYFEVAGSTFDSSNRAILQSASLGKIGYFDPTLQDDFGAPFTLHIYTPNFDGGVRLMKYLHRMDLIADQQTSGNLSIAYSEDDYQTWSASRTFDLTQQRPNIIGCGSFRRRAWHLTHTAATPFRMEAIEFQADMGTS